MLNHTNATHPFSSIHKMPSYVHDTTGRIVCDLEDEFLPSTKSWGTISWGRQGGAQVYALFCHLRHALSFRCGLLTAAALTLRKLGETERERGRFMRSRWRDSFSMKLYVRKASWMLLFKKGSFWTQPFWGGACSKAPFWGWSIWTDSSWRK